ncbi:LysR substrate-binding domain-containing protein [Pseudosulfitobacter sp. SM2401]|uniref:LysR family transcriptional regulator n=1 Tax=Pseudosulfitobacter sp. SM2401 TaxID=3350098 RepID=UPI0036F1E1A3
MDLIWIIDYSDIIDDCDWHWVVWFLDDTSFATLKVLCAVHDLGSFSRSAVYLDKSQSSVSYTIDSLRKSFGDPLFVRHGSGVSPTRRCEDIVSVVRGMISEFERLGAPAEFDPAVSEGTVSVSCSYYERLTILPVLMRRLRADASGVRMEVMQATSEGEEQLKQSSCDMFLSPVEIDSNEVYSKHLFDDEYVCVMSKQNPLASQRMDSLAYSKAPHALVTYGGQWKSFYLRELEAKGIKLNTVVTIPSPASLQYLLAGTDLISTVPRRIAESLGADVKIVESPYPAGFSVYLYWSVRTHNSSMHRWIRRVLLQAVAESESK